MADGGKGRGRRRRAKPIAWTEPVGGETKGTIGSWWRMTMSRLHPIQRLSRGRVVKEEYNNGAQSYPDPRIDNINSCYPCIANV